MHKQTNKQTNTQTDTQTDTRTHTRSALTQIKIKSKSANTIASASVALRASNFELRIRTLRLELRGWRAGGKRSEAPASSWLARVPPVRVRLLARRLTCNCASVCVTVCLCVCLSVCLCAASQVPFSDSVGVVRCGGALGKFCCARCACAVGVVSAAVVVAAAVASHTRRATFSAAGSCATSRRVSATFAKLGGSAWLGSEKNSHDLRVAVRNCARASACYVTPWRVRMRGRK